MARPINVGIAEVPAPILRGPFASNISNLRVLVDGDFLGATVSFNVTALTNTTAIFLLRSMTDSVLAAVQVQTIPVVVGPNTYDDRAASIVGKKVWYWVQLQGNGINAYVGPVSVTVTSGAGAHAVNWVEASSDESSDDFVPIHVVVETFAGADASGGVCVFVQNYLANPAQVLIYQDTTEVLTFHLKITREIVTLAVATVNASGAQSGISAGVNLALTGLITKPCRLTGLGALEGNGFTQISFLASPEPSVTLYRLYRGPFGGTFSGAALVATLLPTDEPSYSIEDNVVNGHSSTYQWYVTAVNASGESTPSDAVLPSTPWM
jgi:hypothetical protein